MKKAFSLIELLIVILIIGVVYSLSVSGLQKRSDEAGGVTLGNLKEYLKSLEYTERAKLLCLDKCESCDVYLDGVKAQTLENFLDDSVVVYRYEYLYGAVETMKDVYFNEEDVQEDVCFSYEVDKSGVGDQVLVEYKEKVYDFTTHLSPTKVYNFVQEAVEAKESLIQEVTR